MNGNEAPVEDEARGRILRGFFRVYKAVISPMLHAVSPTQCKFLPTCSEYAYVAVARHGAVRGTALALWRVARCHPFARGGVDPVPAAKHGGEPLSESKPHHLS